MKGRKKEGEVEDERTMVLGGEWRRREASLKSSLLLWNHFWNVNEFRSHTLIDSDKGGEDQRQEHV